MTYSQCGVDVARRRPTITTGLHPIELFLLFALISLSTCALAVTPVPADLATPLVQKVENPDYTPPVIVNDPNYGLHLQRTMTLLATSTPTHRNTVRILVYGQSITKQMYWRLLQADLRKRFPFANLIMECRAIGGFSADKLWRPAQQDMYDFYPDLVIFHDFGGQPDYERMMSTLRKTTTSEVMMQTNHLGGNDGHDAGYFGWMLPAVAKKYDLELAEIHEPWWNYIQLNKLNNNDLLRDGTHLNTRGCFLMTDLLKPHLVYRPELTNDGWKNWVKDYQVGTDAQWKDSKLTLDFTGNRVDLLAAEHDVDTYTSASVLIDGKKPSEFKGCYTITRPNDNPGLQDWPWSGAITHVAWNVTPLVEDWTVTITKATDKPQNMEFSLSGSKTGVDGAGNTWSHFVSNSGRVVLDPGDWFNLKLKVGDTMTWSVLPMFKDLYNSPRTDDLTIENATTIVQGIDNSKHTLELTATDGKTPPIAVIRVYTPPLTDAK